MGGAGGCGRTVPRVQRLVLLFEVLVYVPVRGAKVVHVRRLLRCARELHVLPHAEGAHAEARLDGQPVRLHRAVHVARAHHRELQRHLRSRGADRAQRGDKFIFTRIYDQILSLFFKTTNELDS